VVPDAEAEPRRVDEVRPARGERRADAGDAHRAHAPGEARVPRHGRGIPSERASGMQGIHGGGMILWDFYARNSGEVLGLVGQHLSLVVTSTAIAIVVGVPGGVLLTRRPAWRGPVLGLANV